MYLLALLISPGLPSFVYFLCDYASISFQIFYANAHTSLKQKQDHTLSRIVKPTLH